MTEPYASELFEPASIHTLELANRFVRSATWTGAAGEKGEVTDETIARMVELADGGVGLIIKGHAYVQPEGQASPRQLAVHDDGFLDGLKRMTDAVHARGGKIALQLSHAGAFALESAPSPRRVVSAIQGRPEGEQPEMSAHDIEALVESFVMAGSRAKAAGFDAVELHSAHGYLLGQFLSPIFNRREDELGCGPEGRCRVHREIIQGIRSLAGDDFPIIVKMNGRDFAEGGLGIEEAVRTAELLESAGCHALELSGGLVRNIKLSPSRMGISSEGKEAYFQEEARAVKQRISIPLILVGGVRSFGVAERMLETGAADFIALSRPLICEPKLISRWKEGDLRPSLCRSDNRCFKPGFEGKGVLCAHGPI